MEQITAGDVEVIGTRNGQRGPVEPYQFSWRRIIYPFEDHGGATLSLGKEAVLFSSPFIDDEQWASGIDDSIRTDDGPVWSKLLVRKEQVASIWAFGIASGGGRKAGIYDTGAPGRPTSAHLVKLELQERHRRGDMLTSFSQECAVLAQWLKAEHPDAPQMLQQSIENAVRLEYRKLKAAIK